VEDDGSVEVSVIIGISSEPLPMRIYLDTIGCRLNEAELEQWSRDFLARGHRLTGDPEQADVVVVNSCAVTGEAVRKSRKLMQRLHRINPCAKLVVSGCYASLEPSRAAEIAGVDLVIGNRDKERLVEIAGRELELDTLPRLAAEPDANPLLARGRHRAFVKVQDGCRYQCTFCIVTAARGEERSRPIPEAVAEINRLPAEGIQEAVLAGVHLGGYGSDRGSDLAELVRRILAETDLPRLRLGAVEPWDLPERFWELFENPRLMPHLHLPLQSGSDTVLKRMARRCKRDAFARLAAAGRAAIPDLNITTDIIVGFPGETDREWRETLEMVERIGFGHLHIFAFSPRTGTLAAGMPHPVPPAVIRNRSRELHRLGERMRRATLERFLGRTFPVLIEGKETDPVTGEPVWSGYTPSFLRIAARERTDQHPEGRIVSLRAEALATDGQSLVGHFTASAAPGTEYPAAATNPHPTRGSVPPEH
jgi:threonylcarbamoyladenosine tRNA methylthiotransferase MtaB